MADRLIVGSIYQDEAPGRRTPAPESDLRTRLLARLKVSSGWDSDHERAIKALLEVMDWHRPWQHWEQVFDPTYIGDRYRGVGCRSCDWMSENDCPTVQAIAKEFGIS